MRAAAGHVLKIADGDDADVLFHRGRLAQGHASKRLLVRERANDGHVALYVFVDGILEGAQFFLRDARAAAGQVGVDARHLAPRCRPMTWPPSCRQTALANMCSPQCCCMWSKRRGQSISPWTSLPRSRARPCGGRHRRFAQTHQGCSPRPACPCRRAGRRTWDKRPSGRGGRDMYLRRGCNPSPARRRRSNRHRHSKALCHVVHLLHHLNAWAGNYQAPRWANLPCGQKTDVNNL